MAGGQSHEAGGQQRLLDDQEGVPASVPAERVDYCELLANLGSPTGNVDPKSSRALGS
jgi:hypothetical protein